MLSAERHAVELVSNTLAWLIAEGELEHPGVRSVLIAARTQVDAALKLVPEEAL